MGGYLKFLSIDEILNDEFQSELRSSETEVKEARFIAVSMMDDRGIVMMPPKQPGEVARIAHIEQDSIEDDSDFYSLLEGFSAELMGL